MRFEGIKWDSLPWAKEVQKHHLPPGSLVYTGAYDKEPFELRALCYDAQDVSDHRFERFEEFEAALADGEGKVCWYNITGLGQEQAMKKVFDWLHLPRMMAEDILSVSRHSSYSFDHGSAFHTLRMIAVESGKIHHESVALLRTARGVITFQETQGDVFEPLRSRIREKRGRIRTEGEDYLYYALLDALVDHHIVVAQWLRNRLEALEEAMMEDGIQDLKSIYEIKKELLLLKNTVEPMTPMVRDLRSSELGAGMVRYAEYLDDLDDHVQLLSRELSVLKEWVDGLHETQMLIRSDRMNTVMTTLTIFSAIFIPLSFAAGVFGMNFVHFPGLDATYGFQIFIGGCAVLAVSMVLLFKRMHWF